MRRRTPIDSYFNHSNHPHARSLNAFYNPEGTNNLLLKGDILTSYEQSFYYRECIATKKKNKKCLFFDFGALYHAFYTKPRTACYTCSTSGKHCIMCSSLKRQILLRTP